LMTAAMRARRQAPCSNQSAVLPMMHINIPTPIQLASAVLLQVRCRCLTEK
jgi:hypothetical protein